MLVVAAEQEENLGLEGIPLPVGVEIGQERVFFKDFQQQLSLEGWLQQARQGSFSDADNTFDGCVHHGRVRSQDDSYDRRLPSAVHLKHTSEWRLAQLRVVALAASCSHFRLPIQFNLLPPSGKDARRGAEI